MVCWRVVVGLRLRTLAAQDIAGPGISHPVNMRRMLTETDPGTAPGVGTEDRAGVSARSMALGLAVGVPVSLDPPLRGDARRCLGGCSEGASGGAARPVGGRGCRVRRRLRHPGSALALDRPPPGARVADDVREPRRRRRRREQRAPGPGRRPASGPLAQPEDRHAAGAHACDGRGRPGLRRLRPARVPDRDLSAHAAAHVDRPGLHRLRHRDRGHRRRPGRDQALRGPPGARRAHAAAVGPALVAGAAALLADPGDGGDRRAGRPRRGDRVVRGGLDLVDWRRSGSWRTRSGSTSPCGRPRS